MAASDDRDLTERFFRLPLHGLLLRGQTVLVLGATGTGKSTLARLLWQLGDSAKVREFFQEEALPDGWWLDAFSTERAQVHPDVSKLDRFVQYASEVSLRAFWVVHLLRRISQEVPDLLPGPPAGLEEAWRLPAAEPGLWIRRAEERLAALFSVLDKIERALRQRDRTIFCIYDGLEQLGAYAQQGVSMERSGAIERIRSRQERLRTPYLRSLLLLWEQLWSRYDRVRAKIFLRDDLLDGQSDLDEDPLTTSTLLSGSVGLEWDARTLYQMLLRHIPDFADRCGVELIGTDPQLWLFAQLRDGYGRVTPGPIHALADALQESISGRTVPLSQDELHRGLQSAAHRRYDELAKEYPVLRFVRALQDREMPMRDRDVARLLAPAQSDGLVAFGGAERRPVGKSQGRDRIGYEILEQLISLGVLIEQRGLPKQVDMSDVFRWDLGIRQRPAAQEVTTEALLQAARQVPAQQRRKMAQRLCDQAEMIQLQAEISPGAEALPLLKEAALCYEEATRLKPDLANAWLGWGEVLGDAAGRSVDDQAQLLFIESVQKFVHAEKLARTHNLTVAPLHVTYLTWRIVRSPPWQIKSLLLDAEALLESLLKAVKNHPEKIGFTYYLRARLLNVASACFLEDEQHRFFECSYDLLRQAQENNPDDPRVPALWGDILSTQALEEGKKQLYSDAEAKYREALALDPRYTDALIRWGDMYLDQADNSEDPSILFGSAIEKQREALLMEPDRADSLAIWGHALCKLASLNHSIDESNWMLAEEIFRRAQELNPGFAEVLDRWGYAYLDRARRDPSPALFEVAREKFLAAESVTPASGAYNLACLHALLDQEDDCRTWLGLAVRNGEFPSLVHLLNDKDLARYRDRPWFRELLSPALSPPTPAPGA